MNIFSSLCLEFLKPSLIPGSLLDFSKIIGYKIIDLNLGEMGIAKDVYQMPSQTILVFDYKTFEIMMPCNDESIVKIYHRKKELEINIPEGLIEVYSS